MERLSITFQSLYTNWEGLKRAALYFDEIILIDDFAGLITPIRKMRNSNRHLGKVNTAISSVPDEIKDVINVLHAEDVVTIIDSKAVSKSLGYDEDDLTFQLEATFNKLHGDQLYIGHPEINAIYNAESPVIECEPDHYRAYSLLYSFFSKIGIQSMCELGLPFCTDSEMVNELLSYGYENGLEEIIKQKGLRSIRQQFSEALLAMNVIETEVPNLSLRSVEDVLEARYQLSDELSHFRTEIASLASQVKASPWEPQFREEIEQIVKGKVKPTVASLERKINTSDKKFLLKLVRNLKSPSSYIPLLATVFTNMPLAAAILASCGLLTLETTIDTNIEKREIMDSNGLSFLLKLR